MRVLATDGWNTTEALSVPFFVENKAPIVEIFPPEGMLSDSVPVQLTGYAYDPEVGELEGAQVQWLDEIGNLLGEGNMLEVQLVAGTHTIGLVGTDPDGNASATWIDIVVEPGDGFSQNDPGSETPLGGLYVLGGAFCILVALGAVMLFALLRLLRPKKSVPKSSVIVVQQKRPKGSCLLSLLVWLIAAGAGGGAVFLVVTGFIPFDTWNADNVLADPLPVLGGGALLVLLGLGITHTGLRAISTRQYVSYDEETGRRREYRGCGAVFQGLIQLAFGLLFTLGGFGLLSVWLFAWLGF